MEEESQKPHRVSRKLEQSGSHCSSQGADDEEPRSARCSRKRCRSWAATGIADCVALCCCPCAVLNLLTLAFVKVPWMIGRKCIGRSKKKGRNREDRLHQQQQKKRRSAEMVSGGGCCGGGDNDHRFVVERDGSLTKEEEEERRGSSLEEETRISARVEAERVWLELYQIGHLGFGRVSFTGIHQSSSLVINH